MQCTIHRTKKTRNHPKSTIQTTKSRPQRKIPSFVLQFLKVDHGQQETTNKVIGSKMFTHELLTYRKQPADQRNPTQHNRHTIQLNDKSTNKTKCNQKTNQSISNEATYINHPQLEILFFIHWFLKIVKGQQANNKHSYGK